MITISNFGQNHGKLGNQLFQVGLLFAVAQRCGYEFHLPRNGEDLWRCFDLDIPAAGVECSHRFDEANGLCNYDPRVFDQPDGTSYRGYFQSYRYLEDCKQSLVRFLRFRLEHRAQSEVMLFACRRSFPQPLVSVHVRRGDYVSTGYGDTWGDLAADGYYQRAVAAIGEDVTYLVFSDEPEWCRRSLNIGPALFIDADPYTSLCMMTECDVNVIANSTFSWWGAFLNSNSDVYAPSRWFGPAMGPPNDVQDIVPPGWRTIPALQSG
jgi:Glycosyl transferase family 11